MSDLEQYIREAARKRGIDPDIAVRVAKSEGGLRSPNLQSSASKGGVREPSYGPFQLLVGGPGTGFPTGMGNDFIKATGMHPSDPNAAYKGIDFALDGAAKNGWGAWYGAAKAGIGNRDGIAGARPMGLSLASRTPQEPIAVGSGQPAPPITASYDVGDAPVQSAATAAPSPFQVFQEEGLGAAIKSLAGNEKVGNSFNGLLSAMGGGGQRRDAQTEAHAVPIMSSLPAMEASDASRIAASQQMMNQLLSARRKKVPGMSLMG